MGGIETSVAEVARLRRHDADIADRMHAEIIKLRAGELTTAMAPLLNQLLRLHDQMEQLAAGNKTSDAGMLQAQLGQVLDTSAGLSPYRPGEGDPFAPTRHLGVERVFTEDAELDGRIANTVKAGFVRTDGSIMRVADVRVYRYKAPETSATDTPATTQLPEEASPGESPTAQRSESGSADLPAADKASPTT
ncbi:MAG: hypothetical protein QG597_1484 [Actinomycetota bacterium]|nr:hypothetical protein [Actinomycetota bacterium]